jgi:serine/threonine-protein kinase TTK/MPS1
VYKVLDEKTARIFALKKIKTEKLDESVLDGYKNEITLLKKLSGNSRIITLHDSEIKKGLILLVMEYGETDLAHILRKENGALNISFIKIYWEQVSN